mmetsp:Transcript_75541/g.175121  ORF Transcript_75541/g.175121 Transcript_75541/m.175121 type:complete len:250 (+) Transcript_75541:64-813(+)
MRASKLWIAASLCALVLGVLCLWSASSSLPSYQRRLSFGTETLTANEVPSAQPEPQLPGEEPVDDDGGHQNKHDLNKLQKKAPKAFSIQVVLRALFGLVFFVRVVKGYPQVTGTNEDSRRVVNASEFEVFFGPACCNTNWWLAGCCLPARQALNFHATGTSNFWIAFLFSLICPNCTTFIGSACTSMNSKLGNRRPENLCRAFWCACCCACCVVLKRAEAIDAATSRHTGCCCVVDAREGDSMMDPLLV